MTVTDFEVPIVTMDDGRLFIARTTATDEPEVLAFIQRLSNYWLYDELRCGWLSPAPIGD